MTRPTCQWCHERLWPCDTGRPARYCRPACRQAAHRARRLGEEYPEAWQRRALAEGWRPPQRPR
jgi:hypothetical protein